MVNKWITFKVAEKDWQAFFSALKVLVRESKLENGCIHYAAFQSKDNAAEFTVLEQWADDEAFQAHRVAPHIQSFKENCGDMILEKSALSLNPINSEENT